MTALRPIRIMPRLAVATFGLPLGGVAELWLALAIGTADYGVYAGLIAISRVLAAVASRGSESGIVRMRTSFPQVRSSILLRWTLLQTAPLATIFSLIAVLIIVGTGHQSWLIAALLLIICPLCTVVMSLQGSLTAEGRTGASIIPVSLVQPLGVAIGVSLIMFGQLDASIASAAWIGFGAWTLALLFAIVLVATTRADSRTLALGPSEQRECRKILKHFTLLTVGNQVLARSDIAILGMLGSPSVTGLYAIISKITGVMLVGMQASSSALRPHFGMFHRDHTLHKLSKTLRRVRLIGIGWALCVAAAGVVFLSVGHQLSERFEPLDWMDWIAFAALCLSQFVIVLAGPISAALNQIGYANRVAGMTLVIAGSAIVLQFFAAPWGIVAIAIATMASRITLRVGLLRIARLDRQLMSLFQLRPAPPNAAR